MKEKFEAQGLQLKFKSQLLTICVLLISFK